MSEIERAIVSPAARPAIKLGWASAWRSSIVLGAALVSVPAYSQQSGTADTTAQPTAVDQSDNPVGGDIIVTAQKRAERLQDVPIAITVVNEATLQNTNSRNLQELNGAVPSIFFAGNAGGGRTLVTLRGATGTGLNVGDEPVAVYVDDVYFARGVTVSTADLLDVGSVEIVRGPQGTLQGRNSTSGAILIRSADPTPEPSGRVVVGISDPYEVRAQAAVSGPLGNGFGYRLAGGYNYARGWAYNIATGRHAGGGESAQFRGILNYKSASPFTARIVGDYSRVETEPAIFRYAATPVNTNPQGQFLRAGTATPNTPLSQADRDLVFKDNKINVYPGFDIFTSTGGVSGTLGYDFGGVDLVSITGYRKTEVYGFNDSDAIAERPRQSFNFNHDWSRQFSQEVRLQSAGDRTFSWILGGFYFNEHQKYNDPIYNLLLSVATNSRTDYMGKTNTLSYAGFADGTLKLGEKIAVIGGIRYTHDRKNLNGYIQTNNLTTLASARTPYIVNDVTWHATNYRAKLTYKPNAETLLYASYGTGFKAGGFNVFLLQAPYDPESSRSWEVGAKGSILDRRINYSLAAYRTKYSNLQLRGGVPTGGAIIFNAASTRIQGLEFEVNGRVTDDFRINANAAFTDGIFTSFPTARNTLDVQTDATGNRVPRAPKWQYFIDAEKDFDLSDDLTITADMNYRWRSLTYFYYTNQNDQPWRDPSGGELGARLTLKPSSAPWQISAFATNLTNTRRIGTHQTVAGYPVVALTKPRSIGASAEYKF